MALVLGLSEGHDVYFWLNGPNNPPRRVVLEEIVTPSRFKLRVEGPIDQIVEVFHDEQVELLPGVRVQAGNTGNNRMVKLAIEAPHSVKILRGKFARVEGAARGV